jgi:hypothetical protein
MYKVNVIDTVSGEAESPAPADRICCGTAVHATPARISRHNHQCDTPGGSCACFTRHAVASEVRLWFAPANRVHDDGINGGWNP